MAEHSSRCGKRALKPFGVVWAVWKVQRSGLLSGKCQFRSNLGRVFLTALTADPRVRKYGVGPHKPRGYMTRKLNLKIFAALLVLLLAGTSVHAQAYLTQSVDTTSLNNAVYDTLNGNAGPFPFNNLGVQATDSLGLQVAASTSGATSFVFPTFTPGQTIAANSTLNYAYNPIWSGGSIGSNAGLSASASFNYNIGPFSGSSSIFDTALNTAANGNIGGGATLTGGNANGTAVGPGYNFGLTESAVLASASVGVNVGVNLQTAISYTPTVQYGYYSWVNTTGGYSSSDVATFNGVSSGPLTYNFSSGLAAQAGSPTFFVNIAPAVVVDLAVTPTSIVQLPISGYVDVSAFGDTLANETLPLGTISAYTANYNTWNDDMGFTGKYYSLELTESNSCGFNIAGCPVHFTVDGSGPLLGTKINLPGGGSSSNLTGGGGTGSWDPNYSNAPLLPSVCDPSTGTCYASNDPNMPVGPGTVTTTDTVATPEPATLPLLLIGLVVLTLLAFRKNFLRTHDRPMFLPQLQ